MFKRPLHVVALVFATWLVAAGQEPAQQTAPPPAAQQEPGAPAPDQPTAPNTAAPGMQPMPVAVDPKSFSLGPQDIVFVQVWREPELTRQVVVRPDGKIGMPLIKEVEASGKTPEELAKDLEKALAEFIKDPEVTVNVLQVNSKKYYVTGQVNRPGAFPLYTPVKVMQALTAAGGFREFANTKKIVILRKGDRIKFNYNDVVKGKNVEQDIFVENGDYIVVP